MLRFFLIYFLSTNPLGALAKPNLVCSSLDLRDINTHERVSSQNTCYDSKMFSILSATCQEENCLLAQKVKALAKQDPQLRVHLIGNGRGNPGYRLCDSIKAKTSYVDSSLIFKTAALSKDPLGVSICMLESDHSFVDVGTLLKWAGF